MSDALLRFRPEFPILEKTTYMISNSLGAMPRGVEESLAEYTGVWKSRGVRAWEETWWELARVVGDEIGELMNAPKGSIAIHQNVTTCEASSISFPPVNAAGRLRPLLYRFSARRVTP